MKTFRLLLLSFFILGISRLSFAESFTARVDRQNVGVNQSIDLKLELSDVQAQGQPDLSEVQKTFQVIGQEQSSVTKIINGNSSSSQVWDINLVPNGAGQASIPPISITTNHGELKTQPITIQVNQGLASHSNTALERGISFIGRASKTQLYKNEPVIVTFRLTSTRSLRNVQLGDLNIKDAIVELQGQPKTQNEIVNGRDQLVLTASYLVTPLKDGDLTIPSLTIRGEASEPSPARSRQRGPFDSFFGNDEDPFSAMQKMMDRFTQDADLFGGFGRMKPVTLMSRPIKINVLPPVAGMDPWLPSANLRLSESWSDDQPKAGDPITRTIMTEASGLAASQLPEVDEQLKTNSEFKVYSDKPETSTRLVGDQIESSRKDIFTIIPQKSGEMTFPPVKLTWWDTRSHKQRVASLPARTLHVLAGPAKLAPTVTTANEDSLGSVKPALSAPQSEDIKSYKWLLPYGLLALAGILLIFLIREFLLLKKQKPLTPSVSAQNVVVVPGKSDLEKCLTMNEIHHFLQAFSQAKWGASANSSLPRIFAVAESHLANFDSSQAIKILKQMEAALYADQNVDVDKIRTEIANLFIQRNRPASQKKGEVFLPELNPS